MKAKQKPVIEQAADKVNDAVEEGGYRERLTAEPH
jgi:hypothetical protein